MEEIQVQGSKRNVVHVNYVLIEAKSTEEAYTKAIELGKMANTKYLNPNGRMVTIRFLGLKDLDVIHDPLEHGCEILFHEYLGVKKTGLRKLVRRKSDLEAFLPVRERPGRPDYASKKIMDEVARWMAQRKGASPKLKSAKK